MELEKTIWYSLIEFLTSSNAHRTSIGDNAKLHADLYILSALFQNFKEMSEINRKMLKSNEFMAALNVFKTHLVDGDQRGLAEWA